MRSKNLNINTKTFFLLIPALFIVLAIFLYVGDINFQSKKISPIIIWAWERPENLYFLGEKNVTVAFYAGSIVFEDNEIISRPRFQPLAVGDETPLIAVVRIDNMRRDNKTLLGDKELLEASEFIIEKCSQESILGCQIDFDAKVSERDFYKGLIQRVREKLPQPITLSITALVSWCHEGSWLEELPINEAVPMFYRMGVDEFRVRQGLVGQSFMRAGVCQKAVGVSTDEPLPLPQYLKNRRVYIFNPNSWKLDDFLDIIKLIEYKKRY